MNKTEFLERLQELYHNNVILSEKKNSDYATSDDPFMNFRQCEQLGVCSVESGLVVRMSDKLSRISNLLNKNSSVSDESILDTLSDLANYSMILRIYIENKNE